MVPELQGGDTILDVFLNSARSLASAENTVVQCAHERWSYVDLDSISTGLALQIESKFRRRPIVAIICENNPYILGIALATWKLAGIVAPIDIHTPHQLLKQMIRDISPTFVVVPEPDVIVQAVVTELSIPCWTFQSKDTTITSLIQRFIDQSPNLPDAYPVPLPEDIAMYIHTSSASSVSNIKCVPLTHKSLTVGSRSRLTWWKKTYPDQTFNHLRVLGWSPWSHIIGWSHDIIAATFLTSGCYVFALTPVSYFVEPADKDTSINQSDLAAMLLQTTINQKTTIFAGVPYILEGIMNKWKAETDCAKRRLITECLQRFAVLSMGGAKLSPECIDWVKKLSLPVVLDMGMTELGGPIFHSTLNDHSGWNINDPLLFDAHIILLDAEGEDGNLGELLIKSSTISKGYLHYDNSAFDCDQDGKITFRTGDIYERAGGDFIIWNGRKEDYIQMISGESLDQRIVEKELNSCPVIAHSCLVGDLFLKGSAKVIFAIIELFPDISRSSATIEVTRAIAAVNRKLAPPLRIAWSRVIILDEHEHIPYTKKGVVFRKKLEELFSEKVGTILKGSPSILDSSPPSTPSSTDPVSQKSRSEVKHLIASTVAEAIGVSLDIVLENTEATFAELGMDSTMAVDIVNSINTRLCLNLPRNACHTFVDLVELSDAVCSQLGLSSNSLPSDHIHIKASHHAEEVVIIGQAVRLPGNINTPQSLWEALLHKRSDLMTLPPSDRWDNDSFYRPPNSPNPSRTGDISFEKSGFINVTHFDNGFFGISAPEAYSVSPTIRLTLEVAFEALEDANVPLSRIRGSSMGVFVAAGLDEGYSQLMFLDKGYESYNRFYGTGVANSTACGRLSYLLDVHGPSVTLDTACSAGLVAFDQAYQYLQSGQGESAIVCGVNTHTWPGTFSFLSAQKMTSINSRCATFTSEADGYVPSEGAAALILKTRSAAIRDRDTILGIVRSTDIKYDGRSQGLVAPNVKAQISLQKALLEKAKLTPSQIDFIEAHGTGTSLGDLIEIQGIVDVFRSSHDANKPLVIGAGKTCLGHTEIAAGLIGVVKALASLKHARVPGLVHLNDKNLNPAIDLKSVPLHIPVDTVELEQSDIRPTRCLILANGFAGTIAGTVLERAINSDNQADSSAGNNKHPVLFVVSAKTRDALTQYVKDYEQFCHSTPSSDFMSICYTSCVGREHYRHRFACVVTSMDELVLGLSSRAVSIKTPVTPSSSNMDRFLLAFPGQGTQYQGMARQLSDRFPEFKYFLAEAATKANIITGNPILSFLLDDTTDSVLTIDQNEIAQVCIFVYQYTMTKWLEEIGIHPGAVMGHSLGEIGAAVCAGAMTFEHGLEFVSLRANLMRADPQNPGGMAAIAASENDIYHYLDTLGLRDRLVIAVYSDETSHVVSGELGAINNLVDALKKDGIRCTKLRIDQGFHSPCIASALSPLKVWLDEHELALKPLRIPLFSTLTGKEMPANTILDSNYWVRHAQHPVRFAQATEQIVTSNSIDIILDLGPQAPIWASLQSKRFSSMVTIAASAKRGQNQSGALLSAIAALFEQGISFKLHKLYDVSGHKLVKKRLPTYPFQRVRHYPTYLPSRNIPITPKTTNLQLMLPERFNADEELCALLDEHRIEGRRVVPGAALAQFFASSVPGMSVKHIQFHQPLVLDLPNDEIYVDFDSQGTFSLRNRKAGNGLICSGTLARSATAKVTQIFSQDKPPNITHSQEVVYQSFNGVHFGEPFRNIRELSVWDDHAEGYIRINPSKNSSHDLVRQLDACLHMFGAIASHQVPQLAEQEGTFLPTSLSGFSLFTDVIPNPLVCRYILPLEVQRNFHVISVAFEVLSETGELVASCDKYSVAWIPKGAAIQDSRSTGERKKWFQTSWVVSRNPQPLMLIEGPKLNRLLYISFGSQSSLLGILESFALHTSVMCWKLTSKEDYTLERDRALQQINSVCAQGNVTVILDLVPLDSPHPQEDLLSLSNSTLSLMKVLIQQQASVSNFIVVSSSSQPVYPFKHHKRTDTKGGFTHSAHPNTGIGSIAQGMLRVYRRETGLDKNVWGIDLPPLTSIPDTEIYRILTQEFQLRIQGIAYDSIVAYRTNSDELPALRLIPLMEDINDIKKVEEVKLSGVVVITGMGSIGQALAPALISRGASYVVFLGRRTPDSADVCEVLERLQNLTKGHCAYLQADVCDLVTLRATFSKIHSTFGVIENIIHSAAVVKDSLIINATESAIEAVLRPKVLGAWNLHNLCEELCLPLKSFVLLSSVSVPLGNPGQVAYVAGNSFMDSLAVYRQSLGRPATSLQLGAWESDLTQTLDLSEGFVLPIAHEEGIPLILRAMASSVPVQVVADFDFKKLSVIPAYANDPYFAAMLRSEVKVKPCNRGKTRPEVVKIVIEVLGAVLEVDATDQLDTAESLNSYGVDSITFAQIRGRILKELEVDVPMVFLSDGFSIDSMISNIAEQCF